MSTQHTHRQAKLIRQQITAQYAEQHALALSGRRLEDELAMAEHKIARLEEQLASTQNELAEARAAYIECNARRIEAETEAVHQQQRAETDHAYMMQAVRRFHEIQTAHNKLSQIIRLALTPAEYHEYRTRVNA